MKGVEVWRRVRLPRSDKEVFVYLASKCGDRGACKVGRKINDIDADERVTLVDETAENQESTAVVTTTAAQDSTAATTVTITPEEITLAQELAALKNVKPKVKGIVLEEPSVPVSVALTKVSTATIEEPSVPVSDALTKVSTATTTTATIPTLRKGFFITELGTPTIRRPSQQPSQTQVQDKGEGKMIKPEPMKRKKPKDLKNKSFDSIQKMFDRALKRVNTFVDFRTELAEGKEKRAGTELEQEVAKKQKMDEDKDTAKLKSLMEVIPEKEEVAINAIPLATKPPTIID
ncbi:hypothetical protein Tco_1239738 [Tanacetum coccineum]